MITLNNQEFTVHLPGQPEKVTYDGKFGVWESLRFKSQEDAERLYANLGKVLTRPAEEPEPIRVTGPGKIRSISARHGEVSLEFDNVEDARSLKNRLYTAIEKFEGGKH